MFLMHADMTAVTIQSIQSNKIVSNKVINNYTIRAILWGKKNK